MIKEEPSGLSYSKILSNFRTQHPDQYRKSFIRLALSKEPFKLSRKKYVLRKKKITKRKPKTSSSSSSTATTTTTLVATVPSPSTVGSGVIAVIPLSKSTSTLVQGPLATVYDNSSVGIVPPVAATSAGVPHWQYEHDGWKNYDKAASDVVEAAYQDWQKNPYTDVRAIKSGEWQYTVDFTNMRQQNIQHENHTTRNVRRAMV